MDGCVTAFAPVAVPDAMINCGRNAATADCLDEKFTLVAAPVTVDTNANDKVSDVNPCTALVTSQYLFPKTVLPLMVDNNVP